MKHFFLFSFLFVLFACKQEQKETPNVIIDPPKTGYYEDVLGGLDLSSSTVFMLIGDWGYQSDGLVSVSEKMGEIAEFIDVDFIATLGDNFYESGVDSIDDPVWDVYHQNFTQESLQIPWYISVGNHDHLGNVQAQIDYTGMDDRWFFPSNFYSKKFSVGSDGDSLSFVVIDSQLLKNNPDELNQIDFIDEVLSENNFKWKIMIGHHPLYSYGHHGSSASMISTLEERFSLYDVDLYISGHDHDMQHIKTENSTHYIIGGSAAKLRPTDGGENSLFSLSEYGFTLITLNKNKLDLYFIDLNGDVVYSYSIEK